MGKHAEPQQGPSPVSLAAAVPMPALTTCSAGGFSLPPFSEFYPSGPPFLLVPLYALALSHTSTPNTAAVPVPVPVSIPASSLASTTMFMEMPPSDVARSYEDPGVVLSAAVRVGTGG